MFTEKESRKLYEFLRRTGVRPTEETRFLVLVTLGSGGKCARLPPPLLEGRNLHRVSVCRFRNHSLLPRVRFSRVGNRFPVLAEFLWVMPPIFLEGFCVRVSLSVELFEGPLGVMGFVSVGTDLPNAARTKPNQMFRSLLSNNW